MRSLPERCSAPARTAFSRYTESAPSGARQPSEETQHCRDVSETAARARESAIATTSPALPRCRQRCPRITEATALRVSGHGQLASLQVARSRNVDEPPLLKRNSTAAIVGAPLLLLDRGGSELAALSMPSWLLLFLVRACRVPLMPGHDERTKRLADAAVVGDRHVSETVPANHDCLWSAPRVRTSRARH